MKITVLVSLIISSIICTCCYKSQKNRVRIDDIRASEMRNKKTKDLLKLKCNNLIDLNNFCAREAQALFSILEVVDDIFRVVDKMLHKHYVAITEVGKKYLHVFENANNNKTLELQLSDAAIKMFETSLSSDNITKKVIAILLKVEILHGRISSLASSLRSSFERYGLFFEQLNYEESNKVFEKIEIKRSKALKFKIPKPEPHSESEKRAHDITMDKIYKELDNYSSKMLEYAVKPKRFI